ncbi:MAG: site-2 protease family protein [bacterium]|nr:site-2 protease family protein [bacterium]
MPLDQLATNPLAFVAAMVALVIGITVHEFSHALAAHRQGDPTPASQGRLTLNPLRHLDPLGTIFLLVAGFGWGKPVQFNPSYLKNPRVGSVIVGLAGPAANLLMVLVFGVILRVLLSVDIFSPESGIFIFLYSLILMNLVLLAFNLIPIPPLDGSKVLLAILPDSARSFAFWLNRYGTFLLFGLIIVDRLLPVSILGTLFGWLIDLTFSLILGL